MKDVAKIGVSSNLLVDYGISRGLIVLGAILESAAIDTGGAGTQAKPTIACLRGGSQALTITKAASHAGLLPGDQMAVTFSKCAVNSSPFLLDGTAKLIVRSNVTSFTPTNVALAYDADLTALSAISNGTPTTYSGVIAAQLTLLAANSTVTLKASVPSSPGFQTVVNAPSGRLDLTLRPGASFEFNEFSALNRASVKLDGELALFFRGQVASFTVATPTPLSGSLAANHLEINATAGVINTTWSSPKLATNVTLSAAGAKVSGDTDGDGSLETTVDSTWADLLQS